MTSYKKRRFNIIIAEDNPLNKYISKTMVEKVLPNARIIEVNNGEEVITCYKKEHIDLILMDLQMPVIDGYKATELIREKEKNTAKTPIIALSGKSLHGEEARCLKSGMNAYFAKPLLLGTVEKIMADYLLIKQDTKTASNPVILNPERIENSGSKLYSLNYINELSDDNEEFTILTLKIFIDSVAERIRDLKEALFKNDFNSISEIAHNIKPSFEMIENEEGAQLCEILDTKTIHLETPQLIEQLEALYHQIKQQLITDFPIK